MSSFTVGPGLSPNRTIYSSIGDEALMFKPLKGLSEYQRKHVQLMKRGIASFSMAQILSSRSQDAVVLDSQFLEDAEFFGWFLKTWNKVGVLRSAEFHFVTYEKMYETAEKLAVRGDLVSTICFSTETKRVFETTKDLSVSQTVNSKMNLHKRAEKFSFETPKTKLFSGPKQMLAAKDLEFPAIVKWDGLGGGENVKVVRDQKELKEVASLLMKNESCLFQELIDFDTWSEYNTDYVIKNDKVEVLNHRFKLTKGTGWIGNIYSKNFKLSKKAASNLENCAKWLQNERYANKNGLIAGLQYFYDGKTSLVFEVNARWGGGTPIAILLDKMKYPSETVVVSHVENVPSEKLGLFRRVVEENLWDMKTKFGLAAKGFKVFPVSFSPYEEDGATSVWILVVGDYDAYLKSFSRALGTALENSELVAEILKKQRVNRKLLNLE